MYRVWGWQRSILGLLIHHLQCHRCCVHLQMHKIQKMRAEMIEFHETKPPPNFTGFAASPCAGTLMPRIARCVCSQLDAVSNDQFQTWMCIRSFPSDSLLVQDRYWSYAQALHIHSCLLYLLVSRWFYLISHISNNMSSVTFMCDPWS